MAVRSHFPTNINFRDMPFRLLTLLNLMKIINTIRPLIEIHYIKETLGTNALNVIELTCIDDHHFQFSKCVVAQGKRPTEL